MTADGARGQQQEIAQAVWGRIRDRLGELDMPMSRLAERSGYSRAALYRWRDGVNPMSADVLAALEQTLQLPHGELLRLAGKPAPALAGHASPVSVAILSADELDQHEKEALLRVYESFMANHRGEDTG
jgi:transcriptional regulator with XRE-family HTH domain